MLVKIPSSTEGDCLRTEHTEAQGITSHTLKCGPYIIIILWLLHLLGQSDGF